MNERNIDDDLIGLIGQIKNGEPLNLDKTKAEEIIKEIYAKEDLVVDIRLQELVANIFEVLKNQNLDFTKRQVLHSTFNNLLNALEAYDSTHDLINEMREKEKLLPAAELPPIDIAKLKETYETYAKPSKEAEPQKNVEARSSKSLGSSILDPGVLIDNIKGVFEKSGKNQPATRWEAIKSTVSFDAVKSVLGTLSGSIVDPRVWIESVKGLLKKSSKGQPQMPVEALIKDDSSKINPSVAAGIAKFQNEYQHLMKDKNLNGDKILSLIESAKDLKKQINNDQQSNDSAKNTLKMMVNDHLEVVQKKADGVNSQRSIKNIIKDVITDKVKNEPTAKDIMKEAIEKLDNERRGPSAGPGK
jgi:hypothetical protein